MPIEIISAEQVSLTEQAELFTDAFSGYVGGSFEMDAAGLTRFICVQGADLCYSRFVRSPAGICGFAYVTRTGSVSRICGMGVRAAARRKGVAQELLHRLLAEARDRSDEAVLLEVIEQNPGARALYHRAGFREIDYLSGWRLSAPSAVDQPAMDVPALKEISVTSASQLPCAFEFPDIPWPVSRHAMAKALAVSAYSLGDATVVISNPRIPGPIRVHSFSEPESPDKWPALRHMLRTVLQTYPEREFFAPPVFPESFSREIFAPLNFVKEPLAQFLMRYVLGGS